MQLCVRTMASLALLAGLVSLMVMGTEAQSKVHNCCTKVTKSTIDAPIIGYRIQRKTASCVRAVVFRTTEGEICSHWKQDWVYEAIKELEAIRRARNNNTRPTTLLPTTAPSSSEVLDF